jgi:N-acetylmuramoyl-L-alanine amidase
MGKFLRFLCAALIVCGLEMACASVQPEDLLRDPSPEEWGALSTFSGRLTRAEFEEQLKEVFDPFGGLRPFLKITDQSVEVFTTPKQETCVATIAFASTNQVTLPETFGSQHHTKDSGPSQPLAGLKVAIDPADIGGAWGSMENRSSYYKGYGLIQEGDLNLLVSIALAERLRKLGAEVFVTRETGEPVCEASVPEVAKIVPSVLSNRPYILGGTYRSRTRNIRKSSPIHERIVAEVLLTKNLEARARAEKVRRNMKPDLTIVLQFDASPSSRRHKLTTTNRNILFVEGAYTASELGKDPRQRYRLLSKMLQGVTPTETVVAVAIANRLTEATGFPPVRYGDSKTTRAIGGSPYVVARNLLLPREHEGPVIVTEPYFMNEAVTLQRLLAGDFEGSRDIGGKQLMSIYREYADAVTDGIVDAYARASTDAPEKR